MSVFLSNDRLAFFTARKMFANWKWESLLALVKLENQLYTFKWILIFLPGRKGFPSLQVSTWKLQRPDTHGTWQSCSPLLFSFWKKKKIPQPGSARTNLPSVAEVQGFKFELSKFNFKLEPRKRSGKWYRRNRGGLVVVVLLCSVIDLIWVMSRGVPSHRCFHRPFCRFPSTSMFRLILGSVYHVYKSEVRVENTEN